MWGEWDANRLNINIIEPLRYVLRRVTSPIDGKSMAGVPSIRVHRGPDYQNTNHSIRWSEVFMLQVSGSSVIPLCNLTGNACILFLQTDDETNHNKDPVDMSKLSEQIAASASAALVAFVDLLAASDQRKIGLRATLHMDNVSSLVDQWNLL